MEENGGEREKRTSAGPEAQGPYFFDALQAVPVPVVPFMELPLTVPV
jgi:hypothetical protein